MLAAEDPSVLRALSEMLDSDAHALVGRASDASQLQTLIDTCAPHVALIDLSILDRLGFAPRLPGGERLPLVVVSQRADEGAFEAAGRAGSAGYLVMPCSELQLRAALAMATAQVVSAPITRSRSGTHPIALPDSAAGADALSTREQEIFDYLRAGHRVADIATRLYISPHTVRKHAQAVFRKLGVHSQVELMGRYSMSSTRSCSRTPG